MIKYPQSKCRCLGRETQHISLGGMHKQLAGIFQSYKKLEKENKRIFKDSWEGILTVYVWTLIKGLDLLSSNQPSCLCAKLNYREQPICRLAWSLYLRRLGNIIAMSLCIVSKKCPFCFPFFPYKCVMPSAIHSFASDAVSFMETQFPANVTTEEFVDYETGYDFYRNHSYQSSNGAGSSLCSCFPSCSICVLTWVGVHTWFY